MGIWASSNLSRRINPHTVIVQSCTVATLYNFAPPDQTTRHNLHEVELQQTSAQIVSTQSLPTKMGARFRFLGKPAVARFRQAGSAPHKSGGRRVKSWPDDTHKQTHSSHFDVCPLSQINTQETDLNQM